MIELRKVGKDSGIKEVLEKINQEAIPECERNSLDDLMDTGAEVLGIFLDSAPVGFFVVRRFKSICYLAYFAVGQEYRCQGTGSTSLDLLIRENSDCQIVVEFENPTAKETDDPLPARRKDFYLRNRFYETGWYTFYDDTEFEIASTSPFFDIETFNEFTEHLSMLVSDHIPKPYRRDLSQLPG